MRILGISPFHDSSVAVYCDGVLEFFAKEERLTRKKRDMKPWSALKLAHEKFYGTIDAIVLASPTNNDPGEQEMIQFCEKLFNVPVCNFSAMHHKCHASLAFYNSGFEEALVFVVDRNGSIIWWDGKEAARESESVFIGMYPDVLYPVYKNYWMVNSTTLPRYQEFIEHVKVNHQRMDWQIKSAYSIVKVYEAATTLIGEHPLENGKTMGLAAYGLQDHYEPLFINQIPIDAYFHHDTSRTLPRSAPVVFSDPYLEQAYGVPKENYQIYAEKAKQVQTETQRTVLNLIKRYVEKYKITNVCITGGYGLNVVANSFYKEHLPECNFYFEPLADDSGNSIGAAMSYYRENTKDNKIYKLNDTFYHYYDDNEKIEIVEGLEKISCSIDDVVNLLSEEKAIGLFQGSPEAGPRALGHRSILFDPRAIDAKDKINQIKNREWYRPFAGMILKEELSNYFEPIFDESPNMTVNFKAKDNCKSVMPGVLHVDNTSRMQTVDSGLLKSLLLKFQDKTGCPSLLNTSMNLAGEPLVQTKKEALHMLLSSNLYGIWFPEENVLVKKLNEQIQP